MTTTKTSELPVSGSFASTDFMVGIFGSVPVAKKISGSNLITYFAPSGSGVTNGNSHDHNGGDGAVIPLAGMANLSESTIIGRASGAGTGVPTALSGSQVNTIIGRYGTSFPASPHAGDPPFFRTDLGFDCYYDGTRWLTLNEYSVDTASVQTTLSASGAVIIGPLRASHVPYFTRIDIRANFASPQDAGNHWTISIRELNASYSAATTTGSAVTTGVGTGSGADFPITIVTPTDSSNRYWLDLYASKTGSAGNISSLSVAVFYRLIIT